MATLAPLTLGMIEEAVRGIYGDAHVDHERQCCTVRFGHDAAIGCALLFVLAVEGDDAFRIYSVRCYSDRRYAPDEFSRVRAECNDWNAVSRWPKAAFETDDDDSPEQEGQIVLEQDVPLSEGAYIALIQEVYMGVYYASVDFWKRTNVPGDDTE